MSSPSFDLSVVREAKENPEKTGRVKSLVFHTAFFFVVFFRVTHDGQIARGTIRSLARRRSSTSTCHVRLPAAYFASKLTKTPFQSILTTQCDNVR